MARLPRRQSPIGYYHITNRGVCKANVFLDAQDHEYFLSCIRLAHKVCEFSLVAHCIMTTHYHLVIRSDGPVPPKLFQSVGARFSAYYHRKYHCGGQIFQGRYRCEPIKTPNHLYSAIRYVWRNPVTAHMCKSPEDYPWSSYRLLGKQNNLIDSELLLSLMDEENWRSFAAYSDNERHIEPFPRRMGNSIATAVIKRVIGDTSAEKSFPLNADNYREALTKCIYEGVTIPQIASHFHEPVWRIRKLFHAWGAMKIAPCSFEALTST